MDCSVWAIMHAPVVGVPAGPCLTSSGLRVKYATHWRIRRGIHYAGPASSHGRGLTLYKLYTQAVFSPVRTSRFRSCSY
jgi:hypothetical protein